MPNSIANIYQGLLPTWNYDFQFAVNLDPALQRDSLVAGAGILLVALIAVAVA